MITRHFSGNKSFNLTIPDNEIWYTSSDGNVVTPYSTNVFGANIVSNTYENGKGVITFDNSVTNIGSYSFYKRSSITSVIIPNSVTSIGTCAFEFCSSLASIVIHDGVTSIYANAFRGTSLTSITIPESVYYLQANAFNIPTLTHVEFNATNCLKVNAYGGGNSYSNGLFSPVNYNCCSYNTTLKHVIFGKSVQCISDYLLYCCSAITDITIPNSVTSIGSSAFRECSGLTSITIPNSVTKIGYKAFDGCSSITTITCEATTPPKLDAGNNLTVVTAVYVPAESVDAYKTATTWNYYADKIKPIP